jgi:hypothetical protein
MVTYVGGNREEKVLTCISNVKHLHAVPSRLEVLGASCKNTKKKFGRSAHSVEVFAYSM